MLREALNNLIVEKGFDAITIRDLVERADIAYATFFRHYESKEALLAEQINLLSEEFEAIGRASGDESHIEVEGQVFFNYVATNEALFRGLLDKKSSRSGVMRLRDELVSHVQQYAAPRYKAWQDADIPFSLIVNHIAASVVELVSWWLDHDMPLSTEKMADIYKRLVIDGTWIAVTGSDEICTVHKADPVPERETARGRAYEGVFCG